MELVPMQPRSSVLGAVRLAPDAEFLRQKKSALAALRWPIVVGATSMLLGSGPTWASVVIVGALVASNIAVRQLPESLITEPTADYAVIVLDTLLLTAGFLLAGNFSKEFFIAYFFVVFLAGVADSLASVILGSLLASLAYLGADPEIGVSLPRGGPALRALFLFSVALCYGGLVERNRRDQEQRRTDETAGLESALGEIQESLRSQTTSMRATTDDVRGSAGALIGYLDLAREALPPDAINARAYIDKAGQRAERIRHFAERELERLRS